MRRSLLLLVVLVVAACGPLASASAPPSTAPPSGGPGVAILPILVNSEIVQGTNRFLFSLTDAANALIAAPDVAVTLEYFDVDRAPDEVAFTGEARFLWAIPDEAGLYVTTVEFPTAGRWGTRFTATFPDGRVAQVRADYDVVAAGTSPALGSRVPSIDTPTVEDVGGDLAAITTDQDPVARLYATSVADALAAGEPFVLAFATPAFCETRLCGPALETVKTVAAQRPDLTFINVEPYRMRFVDGSLQPELDASGQLQPAAWTEAWGLPSEPYTFVIAADGTVAGKFEGVLAEDELLAAVDAT